MLFKLLDHRFLISMFVFVTDPKPLTIYQYLNYQKQCPAKTVHVVKIAVFAINLNINGMKELEALLS